MATTNAAAPSAAADVFRYRGVAALPDGKWRSFIVNREGYQYTIGDFGTAAAAALAHDRTILAILGPDVDAEALNFRAAFSDTELRFLQRARCVADIVAMIRSGDYDAELARFAEHAFDAYMDPELAQDLASFRLRLTHDDALRRRKEEVVAVVVAGADADAKVERDAEREVFLEAARNKATDEAWVERYCSRRRQQSGLAFEDENRWPPVVPPTDINVDDDCFPGPGEELIYLPNGSSYVDEMMVGNGNGLIDQERTCIHGDATTVCEC